VDSWPRDLGSTVWTGEKQQVVFFGSRGGEAITIVGTAPSAGEKLGKGVEETLPAWNRENLYHGGGLCKKVGRVVFMAGRVKALAGLVGFGQGGRKPGVY